ncbi:uncharacterized protein G2W53_020982 [Senna tora]|uniref:Retrotransposon Copia-like N-terminal domain-containing protein n=1 Tax=Senna tora TaxID=362788 RepID=A0A834TII7_9FABA|nr:uncharacterized protein G2W53_020982 [Senna tora]
MAFQFGTGQQLTVKESNDAEPEGIMAANDSSSSSTSAGASSMTSLVSALKVQPLFSSSSQVKGVKLDRTNYLLWESVVLGVIEIQQLMTRLMQAHRLTRYHVMTEKGLHHLQRIVPRWKPAHPLICQQVKDNRDSFVSVIPVPMSVIPVVCSHVSMIPVASSMPHVMHLMLPLKNQTLWANPKM